MEDEQDSMHLRLPTISQELCQALVEGMDVKVKQKAM
jgi:hypothetical protein